MSGPFAPDRLVGACAPLLLWALHFVTVYSVQGLFCADRVDHVGWIQGATVSGMLIALTLATLAWAAWMGWRAHRLRHTVAGDTRAGFLAGTTRLTSVLAVIAILFTAAPLLLLTPCE